MTYSGESSSSGIMVFVEDGTPEVIEPGAVGTVLQVTSDGVFGFEELPPGSGDISAGGSSTDNAIVRWDGTTGKLIQDGLPTIDDSGNIKMPAGQIWGGRLEAASSVRLNDEDFLLICNGSGVSITLPSSPIQWQAHNIKDGNGVAKEFPIVISGVNTIDGCDTATINGNYTCLTLVYNGTEWNII